MTSENPKRYKSPGVDQIAAELIKLHALMTWHVFVRMWSEWLNMYRNYYGQ